MALSIISFGKIDSNSYKDDISRYVKMMRPWAKVDLITLKSQIARSQEQTNQFLGQEAVLLKKKWPQRSVICSLAEEGKNYTTTQFSQWLEKQLQTNTSIVFNIGSAYGLDHTIKAESDLLLSLSPMTMPYKLARLVFVEQLYRALALMHHHPYHKP